MSFVATALSNLGLSLEDVQQLTDARQMYEEALNIYRRLAKGYPQAYLPNLANTLTNLGSLLKGIEQFDDAGRMYEEALGIYKALAKSHPEAYLNNVAVTALDLSLFYFKDSPNKEQSLKYVQECLIHSIPFLNTTPRAKVFFNAAVQIIQDWSIDPNVFLQNILSKVKEA
jgi:tetratricopeptide (TPR) repeat protein